LPTKPPRKGRNEALYRKLLRGKLDHLTQEDRQKIEPILLKYARVFHEEEDNGFKGHVTDSVKDQLLKMKTELVVIPGGMTSVLQPMDVSINKSFKDRLRQRYLT
jgi:hypothetical protein